MKIIDTKRDKRNQLKSLNELLERVSGKGVLPPQDVDIEKSLLGCMLIDRVACQDVLGELGDINDDNSPFYREGHTLIYRAILKVDGAGVTPDLNTVVAQLRKDGTLEDIGGPAYLVELTENIATTTNVITLAKVLQEYQLGREMIKLCEEVKIRAFSGMEDVFELADYLTGEGFRLADIRNRKTYQGMSGLTKSTFAHIEAINNKENELTGITSGLYDLDDMTTGWQKTDLIILAARPSQGKTALALTLARNAALNPIREQRVPVAVFSLEMGAQQLCMRLICLESGADMQSVKKGRTSAEEKKQIALAVQRLHDAPIYIDDTASITPLELRSKARQLVMREGVGMIIVDYLQLMEVSKSMDSREREISTISRSLKAIGKELNIPVIALSQLNRGVESRHDKRPMLSDLRESGAIEQDADIVMFIFRPETYGIENYEDGNKTEGTAEIIIGKQRNGPIGDVRVKFSGWNGRFENLARVPDFQSTQESF